MSTPDDAVDPTYKDPSLPVADRVENLLGQMTLEEKAGLFFHTMITMGEDATLSEGNPEFDIPSTEDYVVARRMNHFNLFGSATDAGQLAQWHNRLQELAASTRLGIPVTISTDPRHAFTDNPLAANLAGPFSQWPEELGLAAIGDPGVVERFGDIARQEYTAVGIRVALHPQIDVASEPRWCRQVTTFGSGVDLSSRLAAAYVRGFQGERLGSESVAAMAKHFPGGGPQRDGEDPHFSYGREQVYPGNRFAEHLKPFEAALEAGVSQMMPYYGMPVGTQFEEVGFGYNKSVVTGLLRERFGFDGIVCTDWGLISDAEIAGSPFPARAWGVEDLSPADRMATILDAGCDQFGGEAIPDLLVELVRSGRISEERIDVSARRLLREKFVLGLFDHPFVDVEAAREIVGKPEFRAAGDAAQRASITVLTNERTLDGSPALPLRRGINVYLEGSGAAEVADYATLVDTPQRADVAILRIAAPFEQRATMFENFFHAGSLEFPPEQIAHIREIAAIAPTIVDIYLDRPAILTPLVDDVAGIVANFGASAQAVFDVLFGVATPAGRLPIEIPRSMAAVLASPTDVPNSTEDPLFPFGHGLDL